MSMRLVSLSKKKKENDTSSPLSPITMMTFTIHGDVDVDDVAVLERAIVRNAVANDLVDRRANRLAKSTVVERRRIRVVCHSGCKCGAVELIGRHAWLHHCSAHLQHFASQAASAPHALDARLVEHRDRVFASRRVLCDRFAVLGILWCID